MRNWFLKVFLCYFQNIHKFPKGKITRDTQCTRCGCTLEEFIYRGNPFDITSWRF